MRVFVPSPVALTPREKLARDLRLVGRCAAMMTAGAGAIVVGMAFGVALGIGTTELRVALAGAF